MTFRQKLIVWSNDRPWAKRIYVWLADRHEQKLADTEFDKVTGIAPVRRADGSIAGGGPLPARFDRTRTEPDEIVVPLDRA